MGVDGAMRRRDVGSAPVAGKNTRASAAVVERVGISSAAAVVLRMGIRLKTEELVEDGGDLLENFERNERWSW